MKFVAEYRQFAEKYRKLSDKLARPKDKEALELMARAWDNVAAERENRLLSRQSANRHYVKLGTKADSGWSGGRA
jgi:hypothetical protein